MKKNLKRLTFLGILTIALVLGLAFYQRYFSHPSLSEKEVALITAYGDDYDAYLKRNAYELKIAQKIHEKLINYGDTFPSFYGGSYISDDSYNLIIQVVKDNIPNESDLDYDLYQSIINMDSTIKIEYVNNSYAELKKINDLITNQALSESIDSDKFIGNYIDVYSNTVKVEVAGELDTISNDASSQLPKSDLIQFVASERKIDTSELKAGSGITTMGITNNCSLGFRAKYNGMDGYITAGHCFSGEQAASSGGIVVKRIYGGSVDAAFVQLTSSSYTLSNSLAYTSGNITSLNDIVICPYLEVGTAIAKAGVKTHYSAGKVLNNSYRGNFEGTTFTDLVSTNAYADGGDSGGPVFLPTVEDGGVTLIGIVKGGDPNNLYSMVFTKEENIYSQIRYARY